MTRAEANALVRDLERIGLQVVAAEPRQPQWEHPGEWQIRCWCPDPAHSYVITDAARFRQAVHNGLTPVLPRGALDS